MAKFLEPPVLTNPGEFAPTADEASALLAPSNLNIVSRTLSSAIAAATGVSVSSCSLRGILTSRRGVGHRGQLGVDGVRRDVDCCGRDCDACGACLFVSFVMWLRLP